MKRIICGKGVLILFLLIIIFFGCEGKREPSGKKQLVVVSFGGDWQIAQRKAIYEPFKKKYGVDIIEVEYKGDYSLIKEKIRKGEWDIIDVEPAELLLGIKDSIYEPIDYSNIIQKNLIKEAINKYGIGVITFAILMGYNSDNYIKAIPDNWKDFWDDKKFPGKRAMHNSPQWMLEIALLSAGVSKENLYPLDMDKAFNQLNKLKSKILLFETWDQPGQLIQRGEVNMTVGTNGRLFAAHKEGIPLAVSWNQGLFALEYYVMGRNSKNKELASKFIEFALSTDVQKSIPNYISYGPTNTKALELIDSAIVKTLPTAKENYSKLVPFDPEWWLNNKTEAIRRYNEWAIK